MTALRTIAFALALALVAACSDDGPEPADPSLPETTSVVPTEGRVGPFAVLAGGTTTRGDLVDGLPIAAGSALLGPTFPDADGEGGFSALLLVTGDPAPAAPTTSSLRAWTTTRWSTSSASSAC